LYSGTIARRHLQCKALIHRESREDDERPAVSPHPQFEGRDPLTREEILDRALAIVDAEGLDALSMRRLAGEFNVEAMALYYYFPNKQAILDGLVNAAVTAAADGRPLPVSDDWRVTMRAGILMVREALLAHPNVVPLVTTGASDSPSAAVWVEGPLTILHGAGLRDGALVAAYHQLVAYVFGWALLSAERDSIWHGGTPASRALSAEAAPVTAALGESLADWGDGFEAGLDAVIGEIDRSVGRARGRRATSEGGA
jgi:AcrR family transcriptional regulator